MKQDVKRMGTSVSLEVVRTNVVAMCNSILGSIGHTITSFYLGVSFSQSIAGYNRALIP